VRLAIAGLILALSAFSFLLSPAESQSFHALVSRAYGNYTAGNLDLARRQLTSALQKESAVHQPLEHAAALNLLADISLDMGRASDSVKFYQEAGRTYKAQLGTQHYLVAHTWRKQAAALRKGGAIEQAKGLEAAAAVIFPGPERIYKAGDIGKPAGKGCDPFYAKELSVAGMKVRSSQSVSDAALLKAAEMLSVILPRSDVLKRMLRQGATVAVIGMNEATTDIPEHRYLKGTLTFDGRDFDAQTRGQGGLPGAPATSASEENLLLLPWDRYLGESLLVHEFAHAVMDLGLPLAQQELINRVYVRAMKKGLWKGTYAASNRGEYFATAVTCYFNAHQRPVAGLHNHVNSRDELRRYDGEIYRIIESIFGPKMPLSVRRAVTQTAK